MNEIQKHIAQHIRGGKWDATKTVDANISAYNLLCLTGMIETREATFADMEAVGGTALVAEVAKRAVVEQDR